MPTTCFRMYTKSQEIVYIKTTCFPIHDSWTNRHRYNLNMNRVLE